jgi:hypothetical protein
LREKGERVDRERRKGEKGDVSLRVLASKERRGGRKRAYINAEGNIVRERFARRNTETTSGSGGLETAKERGKAD